MTTVTQAKSTEIWAIDENGLPKETNLYDWVMSFEDENRLSIEHDEEPVQSANGNWYDENCEWKVYMNKVNRKREFCQQFESEEDAQDYCFNIVYNYDFQNSNENTAYFYSLEECEEDIIQTIADNEYIDKEVAASIYCKSKIVKEARAIAAKIHRAKVTAEYEAKKARLAIEVPAEAASLAIDEQFKAAVKWANEATGNKKSNRSASALKGLLERNGKPQIDSDFWQVYRILKAQTEPKQ